MYIHSEFVCVNVWTAFVCSDCLCMHICGVKACGVWVYISVHEVLVYAFVYLLQCVIVDV